MVEQGACRPAMAIVDQNLPGDLSGVETVQRLRGLTRPHLPALVITGDVLPERLAAIRAAALPYLTKPVDIGELRALVRTLLGDGPGAAANGRARPPGRRLDQLTPRERDVIDLVAVGLANREISARLGISSRTVEGHRAQAMRKLGVRTLAELIHLLVVPPPGLPPHPRP